MGLPDSVAIKLDAYTLFCRQLLTHLSALNDATRTDTRLTTDSCLGRFNELLNQFFSEATPHDLEQAVDELGTALHGRVVLFRAQNPQAASVFDRVIEATKEAAPAWHYQDNLEAFHRQGRELARCFYADSPWPVTQALLDREAQLVFLYEEGAELAFHGTFLAQDPNQVLKDVILVRFTFDCDFNRYLAYPYLFMHEYIAHIFAPDYRNERFNDGWLLHAADAFLASRGWDLTLDLPLVREQIAAFGEHLYEELGHIPRLACRFARQFDDWLGEPERFLAITWELAAFEPQEGESDFWPDRFINHLGQEFDADRSRLRRKIEASSDVRTLFEMLPPLR